MQQLSRARQPGRIGPQVYEIEQMIAHSSGGRYLIEWRRLDRQSLEEVIRLMRDLDHERQEAIRRVLLVPQRHGTCD